jgi:hypothetical protein
VLNTLYGGNSVQNGYLQIVKLNINFVMKDKQYFKKLQRPFFNLKAKAFLMDIHTVARSFHSFSATSSPKFTINKKIRPLLDKCLKLPVCPLCHFWTKSVHQFFPAKKYLLGPVLSYYSAIWQQ